MKREITLLIGAMSLAVFSCSTDEADETADVAMKAPASIPIGGKGRPQSLAEATEGPSDVALWQVGDEDTLVYLLGTVHMMDADTKWETPDIRAALNQADAAYLEADVWSKPSQRAMGVVVTQAAENPVGQTLSSFYNKDEVERVEAVLGGLGVGLSSIENYRPWFASLQMGVLGIISAGGDPTAGADIVIAREMLMRGTPIRYLESAVQQLTMLSSGDDERDADYFYATLDQLDKSEAYYPDLIGAWYDGDTERLDFLVNDALEDHPEVHSRLLIDRNRDWAQQIDRLITDEAGTFLVAVGVGHLVGEGSVQDELSKRGYETARR